MLEQLVKGKPIAPEKVIPKGTVVDLIIGQEIGKEEIDVPCLYGLTKKEAEQRLSAMALNLGNLSYDNPRDSLASRVYDQTPSCEHTKVTAGSVIDLFLTTNKSKIPNPDDLKKKVDDEDFDMPDPEDLYGDVAVSHGERAPYKPIGMEEAKKDEEAADEEMDAEAEVDAGVDMEADAEMSPTNSGVGLSAEEQEIQNNLKMAYDNAVSIS